MAKSKHTNGASDGKGEREQLVDAVQRECLHLFREASGRDFTADDRAHILAALERRRRTQRGLQEERRNIAALEKLAVEHPDAPEVLKALGELKQRTRVRLAAADQAHHQRDRSLLLALLMHGPLLGDAWMQHAALNTARDVAVVALLCDVAEPNDLRGSPALVIDRERTAISKLVEKWAEGKRQRLALARELRALGIRDGEQLEELFATQLWNGER